MLGDPLRARRAIIRDLGGRPGDGHRVRRHCPRRSSTRQAYRDAVDPDAEADAEAIGNIAVLLDAIIGPDRGVGRSTGRSWRRIRLRLLDLLASNYFRRASPKLFLVMQAVASAVED